VAETIAEIARTLNWVRKLFLRACLSYAMASPSSNVVQLECESELSDPSDAPSFDVSESRKEHGSRSSEAWNMAQTPSRSAPYRTRIGHGNQLVRATSMLLFTGTAEAQDDSELFNKILMAEQRSPSMWMDTEIRCLND
jgi:hypothetical protein